MFVFTRELGLIGAHAQGVRKHYSKLRFGLQDFSFSDISLVRGKSGWKIVGVTPKTSWFNDFKQNPSKLYVCAHTISFVRKLVRGEERDEVLFDIVYGAFDFLHTQELSYEEIGTLQCLIMFRILYRLGYVAKTEKMVDILEKCIWNKDVLRVLKQEQAHVLKTINHAIKESHL